jgi:hypothetical protein
VPELAGAAAGVMGDFTEGVSAVAVAEKPRGKIRVAPRGVGGGDAAVADVGGLGRIATPQQGGARGAAGGDLDVVMRKNTRGGGEGVELRGAGVGHAHRPEVVAQIVDGDEEDVGALGRGGRGGGGGGEREKERKRKGEKEGRREGERAQGAHGVADFFLFLVLAPGASPVRFTMRRGT